jgi:hypothetical protein
MSGDWIAITEVLPTTSSSEACIFITEVDYQFMVARQGSIDNPQNRLVSARVSYRTSTLAEVSRCTGLQCRGASLHFEVRSVVSFVWVPDDGLWEDFVPRPPPAIPSLPDDILYPFRFSSSSSRLSLHIATSSLLLALFF